MQSFPKRDPFPVTDFPRRATQTRGGLKMTTFQKRDPFSVTDFPRRAPQTRAGLKIKTFQKRDPFSVTDFPRRAPQTRGELVKSPIFDILSKYTRYMYPKSYILYIYPYISHMGPQQILKNPQRRAENKTHIVCHLPGSELMRSCWSNLD